MANVVGGPIKWSLKRDDDTEREYEATYRVNVNLAAGEGAYCASNASGLPAIGSAWYFSVLENGAWAFCLPGAEA